MVILERDRDIQESLYFVTLYFKTTWIINHLIWSERAHDWTLYHVRRYTTTFEGLASGLKIEGPL